MTEQRKELMPYKNELPSHYWEPYWETRDDEDVSRPEQEDEDNGLYGDEPLPFE